MKRRESHEAKCGGSGTHDGVLIRCPPPDTELLRDETLCDKLSVSSTWRTCRHEITVC